MINRAKTVWDVKERFHLASQHRAAFLYARFYIQKELFILQDFKPQTKGGLLSYKKEILNSTEESCNLSFHFRAEFLWWITRWNCTFSYSFLLSPMYPVKEYTIQYRVAFQYPSITSAITGKEMKIIINVFFLKTQNGFFIIFRLNIFSLDHEALWKKHVSHVSHVSHIHCPSDQDIFIQPLLCFHVWNLS